MGLEDKRLESKRLLIVVEKADYRPYLNKIFMPERLVPELSGQMGSGRVSAEDLHILTAASEWSNQLQEVAIFSCQSVHSYSHMPYLNIRLMGSGQPSRRLTKGSVGHQSVSPQSVSPQSATSAEFDERSLVRLVADFCPTHLVMCTAEPAILRWAVRHKIATVALLSEWQEPLGLWQRWRHRRFVDCLNHSSVDWVGGHGVQASKILAASGIDVRKLIPWEWPQPQLLAQYPPRQIEVGQSSINLAYTGPLQMNAGLRELIDAAQHLQTRGYTITLQLISDSSSFSTTAEVQAITQIKDYAEATGVLPVMTFWTNLTPEQMLQKVHAADLMVMPNPSQMLPVIPFSLSLAMAACTPIVASDHPYFVDYLVHGVNAMIFPTGNARSMAHRIDRIMGQPALYAQLSESSGIDFSKIKVPARWSDLIQRWLNDSAYDRQRLHEFALSSGRYQLSAMQPVEMQNTDVTVVQA